MSVVWVRFRCLRGELRYSDYYLTLQTQLLKENRIILMMDARVYNVFVKFYEASLT